MNNQKNPYSQDIEVDRFTIEKVESVSEQCYGDDIITCPIDDIKKQIDDMCPRTARDICLEIIERGPSSFNKLNHVAFQMICNKYVNKVYDENIIIIELNILDCIGEEKKVKIPVFRKDSLNVIRKFVANKCNIIKENYIKVSFDENEIFNLKSSFKDLGIKNDDSFNIQIQIPEFEMLPFHVKGEIIHSLRARRFSLVNRIFSSENIFRPENKNYRHSVSEIMEDLREANPDVKDKILKVEQDLIIDEDYPYKIIGDLNLGEDVNLYDVGLIILPDNFGELQVGGNLALFNNQLTTLPDSFGELQVGGDLDLDNNQLTTLPDSFGNLTVGGDLWLRYNQLTTLPDSFGNLTVVGGRLSLDNNQLTTLPDSFGDLTVDSLYLWNNQLTTLPDSFGNLTVDKDLLLCYNQLTTLPDSFGNLTVGEDFYLRLDNNQLTTLPDSFGNLTVGEDLRLDYNQLTTLPDSFGNLTLGNVVTLWNNQLTTLPDSFGNLTLGEDLLLDKPGDPFWDEDTDIYGL